MTWYHASPQHFHPGDVIGHHDLPVYLTDSPEPHFTILERALADNWDVYEVMPLTKVNEGHWGDAYTIQVEIVKRVGSARGISNNSKKYFKSGEYKSSKGSHVFWRERPINMKGNFSRCPYKNSSKQVTK